MQQFFLKKLVLLVSFRGQKMREPRPDWSPLGVNFKILDEQPYLFYISSPPPRAFSIVLLFILLDCATNKKQLGTLGRHAPLTAFYRSIKALLCF